MLLASGKWQPTLREIRQESFFVNARLGIAMIGSADYPHRRLQLGALFGRLDLGDRNGRAVLAEGHLRHVALDAHAKAGGDRASASRAASE
jgi:hypothetical protein